VTTLKKAVDKKSGRFGCVYIAPHHPAFLSLPQRRRDCIVPISKNLRSPSAESLNQDLTSLGTGCSGDSRAESVRVSAMWTE